MILTMCKCKIHRATVTEANLDYVGSITIDETLMKAAGLLEFEQVSVANITNGERFETYVIKGEADSGVICINGAAAHKATRGDLIIIIAYAQFEESEAKKYVPRFVFVDAENRQVKLERETAATAYSVS
ncbi:aspartate 1-decarboxylase [bacterium AH-315-J21]|nr:aspartate 1-decarboxylase [bacterium AH-315-J21]